MLFSRLPTIICYKNYKKKKMVIMFNVNHHKLLTKKKSTLWEESGRYVKQEKRKEWDLTIFLRGYLKFYDYFTVWVSRLLNIFCSYISFFFLLDLFLLSILQCWCNKNSSSNSFHGNFSNILLVHFCNLLICVFPLYICDYFTCWKLLIFRKKKIRKAFMHMWLDFF